MRNFNISSLVILGFVLILVCARLPQQPDEDNPMDRNSPDYIPPRVQITTDVPDTISSDSITISWTGNEHIQKTCHYLAGYDSEWSAWDTTEDYLYTYLDEKTYCFYVKGIYANGDSAIDSIRFSIDAITGPAVILYPQLSYSSTNDTVEIQVILEDVSDFMAGQIVLSFPKQCLEIISVHKKNLYSTNTYNQIFLPSITDSTITIETGISAGEYRGYSGTGAIAAILLKNTQIYTAISIDKNSCTIKNIAQEEPTISTTRGALLR